MVTKKITLLTSVVLPILVIGATLGLALLFRPEETTSLFWINLVYGILLEGLFFGWMEWFRRPQEGTTPMLSMILSVYAGWYVLCGGLCILGSALASIWTAVDIRCATNYLLKEVCAVVFHLCVLHHHGDDLL